MKFQPLSSERVVRSEEGLGTADGRLVRLEGQVADGGSSLALPDGTKVGLPETSRAELAGMAGKDVSIAGRVAVRDSAAVVVEVVEVTAVGG
mgnify:FL=1